MQAVVASELHSYEDAPSGAHKVVELPLHIELLPVIEQVIGIFTVTDLLQVLVHPLAAVAITV